MKDTKLNSGNENKHNQQVTLKEREYRSLLALIRKLQLRIEEMETSKFWKLKKLYDKLNDSSKPTKDHSRNRTFFGKIGFLLSLRGRKTIKKVLLVIFKNLYLWLEEKPVTIIHLEDAAKSSINLYPTDAYGHWRLKNSPRPTDLEEYRKNIAFLPYKPLVSIIVPVYNTRLDYLDQMIQSVRDQVYPHWELCLADDCSTAPLIKSDLKKHAESDPRIKIVFRKENGHISKCSNSALEIATGEFIGLLDHDDLLSPDALYEVVRHLNLNSAVDIIYSDEDKVDDKGLFSDPHFKPDWCPENLLSRNYISHFAIVRTSLMNQTGGFREGFEGSQDYDLYLRLSEITTKIHHIPKVLYHWRIHPESVASNINAKSYAFESGVKALNEALLRRKEEGTAQLIKGLPGFYTVRFKIKEPKKISIIIATKDKSEILEQCLYSIFTKSTYKNFEVILISNNSTEQRLEELLQEYHSLYPEHFHSFKYDIPFNFAKLMNYATSKSTGEYVLFLNNDTEVITPDWMEGMLEQAQRKEIGVVGVKLLYPNDTIQHAGVVIGMGGAAGHSFVGKDKNDLGYFSYLVSLSNYSAVTAACVMCKRELFDQVGGFDERFEIEYNDTDFCLKIKDLGYRNVYVPHVVLYHHESITRGHPTASEESTKRHLYEVSLFKKKWAQYIKHDPCFSKNLSLKYTDFRINESSEN